MLIAPTVLGQEVSTTGSTETSAASTTTSTASTVETSTTTGTSVTAASEASSESSDVSVVSSEGSQSSASAPASPQPQAQTPPAATSTSSASSSSSEDKASKAATSSTSSSTPAVASSSSNSNQATGTEVEPQMMEVEQYTVNKESSELKVKDGKEMNGSGVSKKLIRNRDGEQRDIFDIKREVKTNADGTIDVTVTVTPKEIDKGADVMALLDVSKKMSKEDFNNAKTKIKQLVKTLTEKNGENHNSRNSVRLMTFYREISDPIDISGKTEEQLDKILNDLREKAKANYDWGVDLQGAIHKAREIFKRDQEKKSGKRQHIVLFSQGESTFSYDIKNKNDSTVTKTRITEKVTTSNPLLPWPPIFDHTHQNADMLEDSAKLIKKLKSLGLESLQTADNILQALQAANRIGSLFGKSPTEYLTLNEYDSNKLGEESFDYSKHVGEGYYYHSFSDRKSENTMPLESAIKTALTSNFPKIPDSWFFGILKSSDIKAKVEKAKLDVIMQVLKSIFYKREYRYYNHNLSAIAEAKMAQKDGITFYSVDVTSPNQPATTKRSRRSTEKKEAEERNEKFDKYLKEMSEGGKKFFNDVDKTDKFKDTLTELKIKDEFTDKVTVEENSWNTLSTAGLKNSNKNKDVQHQKASQPSVWSFTSPSKESLTWTISKEQLKEAFEKNGSLTFKYKLRVNKDKLLDKNKNITKRDTSTEDKTSVTANIISNTTTYKINDQEVKGNNLDDVNLTYSKFKVPVPQIDGHVIEPQAPTLPKLPPVIEHGPNFEYEEETGYQLPLKHGSNAPDTQVTIEEDTVPQRPDILVGGQSGPVDITEDTQPGMSGSNDATVIEEDTKPKRFFHFENEPQAPEKPKEQPSLSLPQAPVYKAAHHLPASGDKREASFTIVALTIIGAAGLLSKKRRDTEEN